MNTPINNEAEGLFGIAQDHFLPYQSLDDKLIKDKLTTFFFKAEGECMSPFINNGDILIVDRSIRPFHRSVAIVIFQGELLCRRLFFNGLSVGLCGDAPETKTITLAKEEQLRVWGVVTTIIKNAL